MPTLSRGIQVLSMVTGCQRFSFLNVRILQIGPRSSFVLSSEVEKVVLARPHCHARHRERAREDLYRSSLSEGCFEPVGKSFDLPQPPYAGNSDLELVFFFTSYFFTQVLLTAGPSVWRVHGAMAPLLLLLHEELLQSRRPRLHH